MNKHTPTPWRIGKGHCVVADEPVPGMDGSDAIEYYGGHLIAESITTENCEHIVRCVNSHDALVAQMINALELIELLRANSSDRVVVENTQLAPMYAALAAAGAPQ